MSLANAWIVPDCDTVLDGLAACFIAVVRLLQKAWKLCTVRIVLCLLQSLTSKRFRSRFSGMQRTLIVSASERTVVISVDLALVLWLHSHDRGQNRLDWHWSTVATPSVQRMLSFPFFTSDTSLCVWSSCFIETKSYIDKLLAHFALSLMLYLQWDKIFSGGENRQTWQLANAAWYT